jgi:hypothetical protein
MPFATKIFKQAFGQKNIKYQKIIQSYYLLIFGLYFGGRNLKKINFFFWSEKANL